MDPRPRGRNDAPSAVSPSGAARGRPLRSAVKGRTPVLSSIHVLAHRTRPHRPIHRLAPCHRGPSRACWWPLPGLWTATRGDDARGAGIRLSTPILRGWSARNERGRAASVTSSADARQRGVSRRPSDRVPRPRSITPGHVLVVPNDHHPSLDNVPEDLGARVYTVATRLAAALRRSGLPCAGITLLLADGEAASQEVAHIHLHVVPRVPGDGFTISASAWAAPRPSREALDADAAAIRVALIG